MTPDETTRDKQKNQSDSSRSSTAKASPLTSLIAGGLAGGVEGGLTYPLEFAKTRVQLHSDGPVTRNPYGAVAVVYREEGIRALYKGCSAMIFGSIAKDAVRFLTFDSVKAAFADPETGALTPVNNLLAGMTSGIVASATAVTPTERIKTALIDDAREGKGRFRSPVHAIQLLVREQGLVRGLYRGFTGNTLKQATATSVRLGVYNILKEAERARNIPQSTLVTLANGALTGTIVVYLTQPFDCIKTRSQSAAGAAFSDVIRSISADHGLKGYWRGSTMRLGRVVLSASILFTTYEWIAAIVRPLVDGPAP